MMKTYHLKYVFLRESRESTTTKAVEKHFGEKERVILKNSKGGYIL